VRTSNNFVSGGAEMPSHVSEEILVII